MRGWRIWYAGGSTFDSSQGTWAQAPDDGVQVLMLYHGHDEHRRPLRTLITGVDEYRLPGRKTVKRGTLMEPESAYEEIRHRALAGRG